MANFITLSRVILALCALAILKISPLYNLVGTLLIITCLILDAVDGYVARNFNTVSVAGSVYDILADRIIENIFFIYFASQSLFSIWLAFIILIRGLTIDAIRNIFSFSGKTAFGEQTLHTAHWAKLITCSRTSRGIYNGLKIITFILFAQLLHPQSLLLSYVPLIYLQSMADISLGLCISMALLRAIPVIYENGTNASVPHK